MTKYLCIENTGVAPLESFTIMGLSTARGKNDKIGQFGSGNKHGVMTCMRHNISPRIFLGTRELEFFTEKKEMNGTQYDQLGYMYDGKHEMLSYCLAHGAMDWDNVPMALREFVSNALDATNGDTSKIKIDIVDGVNGQECRTKVFVPLTPDVEKFYENLDHYFMHFRKSANKDLKAKVFDKLLPSPATVYRKGTFVRTVKAVNSVYNYNFGDELKIDESRTMDDWSVKHHAARMMIADSSKIVEVIKRMNKKENIWEASFESYSLSSGDYRLEDLIDVIKAAFGKDVFFTNSEQYKRSCVEAKKNAVLVTDGWAEFLCGICGFPSMSKGAHSLQVNGYDVQDANEETKETATEVWNLFKRCNMTMDKAKPKVYNFDAISSEKGCIANGYFDPKTNSVYIRKGCEKDIEVMMEEFIHYITNYDDFTRGFQDFALKLAAEVYKSYKRSRKTEQVA